MNIRKHIGLVISGAVFLVLVLFALLLLFRFSGEYRKVSRTLEQRLSTLDHLKKRDPFPSEDNVKRAQENLKILDVKLAELQGKLIEGQIETKDIQAASFPPLLEEVVTQLRLDAKVARVVLPDGFAFGFDRYLRGELPNQEDIPRLVIQVKIVQNMARLLFDSHITELEKINRELFDEKAAPKKDETTKVSRRRRRVPAASKAPDGMKRVQKTHELYTSEPFCMVFKAPESSFWDVLNKMDSSNMFTVVVDIDATSEIPAITKEDAIKAIQEKLSDKNKSTERGMRRRPLDHEERVVSGREELTVKLSFDVYRFKTDAEKEASK